MVSPEHVDNHKPEDQQAPTPAVEKQVPAVVEKKRPWLKPLMRVAAIVLSLVGSFALVWATFIFLPGTPASLALPEGLLLGVVCAALFRSWWAILVVPIAFTFGALLAIYLIPLVYSPNPLEIDDVPFGVFLWVVVGPFSATIGALFGTYIDKEARKQGRQQ
jgi:hypothetical protein